MQSTGAALLCFFLALTAGCNDSEGDRDVDSPDFPREATVQPGDTLMIGLPAGVTFPTMRCFGHVAVTIEAFPGSPLTNRCSGDGSSSRPTWSRASPWFSSRTRTAISRA